MTTSTSGGVDLDQVLVVADASAAYATGLSRLAYPSALSSKRAGKPRSPTSKTSTRDASPT